VKPEYVIFSSATALKKVRGKRRASRGRITTVPPDTNVGNRLAYEPSKWKGETHNVFVVALIPSVVAVDSTAAAKAADPIKTPLGVPVVPEV